MTVMVDTAGVRHAPSARDAARGGAVGRADGSADPADGRSVITSGRGEAARQEDRT
ncbi:hypothetical protein [Micromonospora sp. NPDC048830]|uniref:hypothetical protein n=1 Tax=Micromonospora sp. NPDC048830 TaxID=3364257 RepID=UPI0037115508